MGFSLLIGKTLQNAGTINKQLEIYGISSTQYPLKTGYLSSAVFAATNKNTVNLTVPDLSSYSFLYVYTPAYEYEDYTSGVTTWYKGMFSPITNTAVTSNLLYQVYQPDTSADYMYRFNVRIIFSKSALTLSLASSSANGNMVWATFYNNWNGCIILIK